MRLISILIIFFAWQSVACSHYDIFIQRERLCVYDIKDVYRGNKLLHDVIWKDADGIPYTERVEVLTDKIGDCKIFLVR